MRAVIDTNILISGLVSKRTYPAKVLDLWIMNRFEPVISNEIVKEYSTVLVRDKFSCLGSVKERLDLLNKFLSLEHVIMAYPLQKADIIKDDPKDNIFLECSIAGNCKFVVSGDQHLLRLKEYGDTRIVTAEEFVRMNVK